MSKHTNAPRARQTYLMVLKSRPFWYKHQRHGRLSRYFEIFYIYKMYKTSAISVNEGLYNIRKNVCRFFENNVFHNFSVIIFIDSSINSILKKRSESRLTHKSVAFCEAPPPPPAPFNTIFLIFHFRKLWSTADKPVCVPVIFCVTIWLVVFTGFIIVDQ